MSTAVAHARRIGKILSQRPGSIALRKAVWREMEPLRHVISTPIQPLKGE